MVTLVIQCCWLWPEEGGIKVVKQPPGQMLRKESRMGTKCTFSWFLFLLVRTKHDADTDANAHAQLEIYY